MLTASDVEQKTFSTALRGYDLDEVDDFLDEIVATIKQLTEQLEEARSANGGAPAVMTTVPAPQLEPEPEPELEPEPEPEPEAEPSAAPPRPDIDESAIGRALVAAQTAADRLLEEAEREASRIMDEARSEADSLSAERDERRREAAGEMAALAARVASVRSELSVLAGEVAGKLDDMDSVIEGTVEVVTVDDDENEDTSHDRWEENASVEVDDDSEDRRSADAETATGEHSSPGSDHLDDILNGVANDLQLNSDHDEGSEEPEEDE